MPNSADSKALSQARYTQFAEGYVTSETHAKGSDLDRLLAIAGPQPHWFALDIATGGGHTALKFAPHVDHIVASDLTPRMLEQARQFIAERNGVTNVSFQMADAENLPFDPRRFDLLTCRIAPHHFPDAGRFVHECARVLKRDGLLILQDQVLPADIEAARFVDRFERLRDPSHNRAFNADEWREMCQAAGFTVEHSEHYIKRHDFIPWAQRQGVDKATMGRLNRLMRAAPAIAREWMDPRDWGSDAATFVNRHVLIRGRLN